LAVTVAVPTVVPPLVHVIGAEACGPNTLNVIVPVGLDPPDRVEVMAVDVIDVPAVPDAGAAAVAAVVAGPTAVEAIPAPHVLDEAAL
jgi:hypothetical protein